ncbi:MAG: hypothetical protein Q8R82_12720 [Hyphomonadaceae bacterium]|nr:hypothetical protein [Hyphomonadaceae bacterium]
MKGKIEARKYAHRELAWAVWHGAVLPNTGKKFPTLRALMGLDEDPIQTASRKQSPEEIAATMTRWMFEQAGQRRATRATRPQSRRA